MGDTDVTLHSLHIDPFGKRHQRNIKSQLPEQALTIKDIDQLPSRPFNGFDWSEHTHVSKLINEIFAEYAAWYKGDGAGKRLRDRDKIKQHLTHFVLEAYRTYKALSELALGVRLGNKYYNEGGGRYHPNHLSYRVVKNVTDFLVAAGYLVLLQSVNLG